MEELEKRIKELIDKRRRDLEDISDFQSRTELQGYIKGLENALKLVRAQRGL